MNLVGTMVIASGAVDSCSTELSSDEAHHGRSVVGVEAARTQDTGQLVADFQLERREARGQNIDMSGTMLIALRQPWRHRHSDQVEEDRLVRRPRAPRGRPRSPQCVPAHVEGLACTAWTRRPSLPC